MAANLDLDTITEAWEDVKDLVHKRVWAFIRRYGGDHEEVEAEAYLAFCRAFRSYNPERGALTTLVQTCVDHQLYTMLSKRVRHNRIKNEPADLNSLARDVAFDARAFCRQVSEDAATMFRMVCGIGGNRPGTIKKKLVEELKSAGWTAARINHGFEELKGALE